MPVQMMGIGYMGMGMVYRPMPVRVAVGSRDRQAPGFMLMVVVPIVMAVGMLMLQGFVAVFMGMVLRQMQPQAGQHQQAAEPGPESSARLAQAPGQRSAREGRKSKH